MKPSKRFLTGLVLLVISAAVLNTMQENAEWWASLNNIVMCISIVITLVGLAVGLILIASEIAKRL